MYACAIYRSKLLDLFSKVITKVSSGLGSRCIVYLAIISPHFLYSSMLEISVWLSEVFLGFVSPGASEEPYIWRSVEGGKLFKKSLEMRVEKRKI